MRLEQFFLTISLTHRSFSLAPPSPHSPCTTVESQGRTCHDRSAASFGFGFGQILITIALVYLAATRRLLYHDAPSISLWSVDFDLFPLRSARPGQVSDHARSRGLLWIWRSGHLRLSEHFMPSLLDYSRIHPSIWLNSESYVRLQVNDWLDIRTYSRVYSVTQDLESKFFNYSG